MDSSERAPQPLAGDAVAPPAAAPAAPAPAPAKPALRPGQMPPEIENDPDITEAIKLVRAHPVRGAPAARPRAQRPATTRR